MSNLNLNKVIVGGRMTADPELKQTSNGATVTSFCVAVNRRYKNDGVQSADFINVVAWRATAEFICKFFRKGSSIALVGAIQTRSWTDQSGNKRYATEVVADEAYFVDNKDESAPSFNAAEAPRFEDIGVDEALPF